MSSDNPYTPANQSGDGDIPSIKDIRLEGRALRRWNLSDAVRARVVEEMRLIVEGKNGDGSPRGTTNASGVFRPVQDRTKIAAAKVLAVVDSIDARREATQVQEEQGPAVVNVGVHVQAFDRLTAKEIEALIAMQERLEAKKEAAAGER